MPYTDFHYTPTGTGVISGKEVLEQTEDAINDLGGQISGDVQTAIDTANNALNVANTASSDAQNAVNTANTAYTTATNAQNTANAAQTTATNAQTAAQNAQNDVNALGNRVTTAENNITQNTTDISGLTTRMGTAEGNITNLQNDVITAQGTATSAQNTATMARQQAYVLRYSSTAITDNSTIAYSTLDNTDNIKADDKILDVDGKIFSIVSVDSDNSTVTVGSALIDLAQDSNVVHKSGDETIGGLKTFENNRMVVGRNTDIVSVVQFVNSDVVGDSANGTSGFEVYGTSVSDANKIGGVTVGEYSNNGGSYVQIECNRTASGVKSSNVIRSLIRTDGSKELSSIIDNDCKLGSSFLRWSKIYGTEYYYGSNNVEFSTKFVTTDTNQTISGNKTFSSINGVEPSSLSLPSDRSARIDISGYFTNTGTVNTNNYSVPANGFIFFKLNNINQITCYSTDSSSITNYAQTYTRPSDGVLYITFPVRKNDNFRTIWNTGSSVSVESAYFIPCQGNV